MDERIEAFLADVLALEGENDNAIREGVRMALADCEQIFKARPRIEIDSKARVTWLHHERHVLPNTRCYPLCDLPQTRAIQHTVKYTELAPTRFKNFWR